MFGGEADMPEPVSAQFVYQDELVFLVGEPFLARDLEATGGAMSILRGPDRVHLLGNASGIGFLDPELVAHFVEPGAGTIPGRWVALDAAPRPEALYEGILTALNASDDQPLERLERRFRQKKGLPLATMLVGFTFLEEGPARHEERRTWLFTDIEQKRGEGPRVRRLLQAQAIAPNERARRVPELAGLKDTHIVVIGAGSLGAPVAVELAKTGVGQLDLFDGDRYDVNNSVRHILPAAHSGAPKVRAVAEMCQGLNPFIQVRSHELVVGKSVVGNTRLEEALTTANVVIDTTGVQAVGRFLGPTAHAADATLIVAGVTAGSYGADLFVIVPGEACFNCFLRAQDEETIPRPPAGPRSAITPIGCRHPTFSGAGFEATELAAIVSRRAIQATKATSYPGSGCNWMILSFRGAPHFQEGRLDPVPECEIHP